MNPYEVVLRLTDDAIPFILSAQQNDPARRDFRGHISPEKGFAEPIQSASAAGALISAYFCKDSKWYGNDTLLDAAINSLAFLNDMCHEDGSIDLLETNFHDCTGNAFAVQHAAYSFRLLEREAKTTKELEALAQNRAFLEKSAKAMLTGGFHTPNHRWVVASALSLCYRCLDDPECLKMAEVYLSEGIDCNEEGDYTERSVGIYDVVNNESLTIIAEELGKNEIFEAVDRNLNKNWYYIEPDLTGLTLASRRQDYGAEPQMVRHYYSYYQAALRTGNGQFAWMANKLLKQIEKLRVYTGKTSEIGGSLYHQNLLTRFLLNPVQELPKEEPMPVNYSRYFNKIGVARFRENDWTCSLLRDNSIFMKLQNKNLKIYAKLACTFFQHGRFIADEIIPIEGGHKLTSEREWGYIRPIPGINEPDWHKIDRNAREKANMQKHRWQVDVNFRNNGVTLLIRTEGTPRIPMKLELIMPPGGLLKAGGITMPAIPGGWAITGDCAIYNYGGDYVHISGGFNEHNYAENMRNSDPKPPDRFCLYCTGFTPVERAVLIDFS